MKIDVSLHSKMMSRLRVVFNPLRSILLVVALFVSAPIVKSADEVASSGFRITPVRYELEIYPGFSETKELIIENVVAGKQTAVVVIDDFAPNEDEKDQPKLLIGDDAIKDYPYSIKPFVSSIKNITLKPGQKKTVKVTVTVPEGTPPGAYYGAIGFVTGSGQSSTASNVLFSAGLRTIFLITVPGKTQTILQLAEVKASKGGNMGSFFTSPPDSVAVRLTNAGNTFIIPFGKVIIRDWRGNEIYSYEINNTEPPGNILPASTRKFEDSVDSIGIFGRFTIEVNVSYGDGSNLISAKSTFWVIPWLTILAVLIIIIGLVLFFTKGLKAYNARVVRRSRGQ